MPKAKPDQVIVHRIELQETDRATLEAALAGNFVTNGMGAAANLLKGAGSLLIPFAGAFTGLAGLGIADRTIDEVIESIKKTKEVTGEAMEGAKSGVSIYEDTVAWLNATYANTAYQYLNYNGPNPADEKTSIYLREHFDYLSSQYGSFDGNILRKVIAQACQKSRDDPLNGTPAGWFVKLLSLGSWADYNAAHRIRN